MTVSAGRRSPGRRGTGADRLDDLAVVDPLQVDGRDAEVRVAELALDDVERHAFACHLDCVRVSKLIRSASPAHTRADGERAQRRSDGSRRPRPSLRRPVDGTQQRADRKQDTISQSSRCVATVQVTQAGHCPSADNQCLWNSMRLSNTHTSGP